MNSATARTIRETCGLTYRDIADALDVNIRTVQRWEGIAYSADIPDDAAAYYVGCLTWLTRTVSDAVGYALAMADTYGEPETVDLSRYVTQDSAERDGFPYPIGLHAAAQGHILEHLAEQGMTCNVTYTQP